MKPERFGIEFMSIGGGSLENLRGWKGIDVFGGTFYYYGFPKNAMNDWLVAENQKRFKQPPDLFTAGGFVAACALIAGIKKANSVDTDKLVAALENLEFDTPKGKIQLRKEDHQGLQTQYAFKVKKNPANEWDIYAPRGFGDGDAGPGPHQALTPSSTHGALGSRSPDRCADHPLRRSRRGQRGHDRVRRRHADRDRRPERRGQDDLRQPAVGAVARVFGIGSLQGP
jgi:hypothetical protein